MVFRVDLETVGGVVDVDGSACVGNHRAVDLEEEFVLPAAAGRLVDGDGRVRPGESVLGRKDVVVDVEPVGLRDFACRRYARVNYMQYQVEEKSVGLVAAGDAQWVVAYLSLV